MSRTAKIHRKIVYFICVQNVWIRKKIECPVLSKFNGKLCTLYMYGMSGLVKKLKVKKYHYGLISNQNRLEKMRKRENKNCCSVPFLPNA